jgi:plasmid replication initiation protein
MTMAKSKPTAPKTAAQRLAEKLLEVDKLRVEAAAEEIEGVIANTKVVAEYEKMRKDESGKERKDFVILAAIAKAVGAKGVEIKPTKTPQRKPRDPNAPKRTRKPKQPAAT